MYMPGSLITVFFCLLIHSNIETYLLNVVTFVKSLVGYPVRLCYPKFVTFKVHVKYHT